MRRFPRSGGWVVILSCILTACPAVALGDSLSLLDSLPQNFILHNSQGYLGVDLKEIDSDRASQLKLKEVRGAEIVNVDHDAPAGTAGLKVHDVILQVDGQAIEGVEQLRQLLHQTAPGRTITLLVNRDGNELRMTIQLADRALLQQQAWLRHFSVPEPAPDAANGQAQSNPSPGDLTPSSGSSFLGGSISGQLYVGADVNPVRGQLCNYFGVKRGAGLLVESVDYQSPAARAGLKAGDVILKVNSDRMASRNDWLTAIRNHLGHQVQLTVMRDKQLQTLTMVAGEGK